MTILFHNDQLVVCIKPIGKDSEHQVPALLCEQLGGEIFTVHRLDRLVGGVMVYARTKKAAAALSKAITDGSFVKYYVARVHGTPPSVGDWEDLLFKDSSRGKVFPVKRMRRGVKQARLEYTRLTDTDPSLVRVRLHTGRTHQIRVQFASRGYPLVGDRLYGAKDTEKAPLLFSCCVEFPFDGISHRYEALPDWAQSSPVS